MEEEVGAVNQRFGLAADRRGKLRMRVPERRDAHSRNEVEIRPAVRVEQTAALPALEDDTAAPIHL
jgi:hypothetical protein